MKTIENIFEISLYIIKIYRFFELTFQTTNFQRFSCAAGSAIFWNSKMEHDLKYHHANFLLIRLCISIMSWCPKNISINLMQPEMSRSAMKNSIICRRINVISDELASCDLAIVSNKIANNIKVGLRPPLKPYVYTFKGGTRSEKMTVFDFAQWTRPSSRPNRAAFRVW